MNVRANKYEYVAIKGRIETFSCTFLLAMHASMHMTNIIRRSMSLSYFLLHLELHNYVSSIYVTSSSFVCYTHYLSKPSKRLESTTRGENHEQHNE